jgi:hypothetical protein
MTRVVVFGMGDSDFSSRYHLTAQIVLDMLRYSEGAIPHPDDFRVWVQDCFAVASKWHAYAANRRAIDLENIRQRLRVFVDDETTQRQFDPFEWGFVYYDSDVPSNCYIL